MKLIAFIFAIVLLIVAELSRAETIKYQAVCWSDKVQQYIPIKIFKSRELAENYIVNKDCYIEEIYEPLSNYHWN